MEGEDEVGGEEEEVELGGDVEGGEDLEAGGLEGVLGFGWRGGLGGLLTCEGQLVRFR